jgi:hypothetical protein
MLDTKSENNKLFELRKFLKDNSKSFWSGGKKLDNYNIPQLYHYTSLPILFDILESDSLWLSGLRFSNDSTEEKLLGDRLDDHNYHGDNFVFCVADEHDLLSQWRGYCLNGGASIGLDIGREHKYSVLYDDFDITKKHIDIDSIALPVLYLPNISDNIIENVDLIIRTIKNKLKGYSPNTSTLCLNNFVPYIKHNSFSEEKEWRLLISNTNGELSKCVRFRRLKNGTKIPYIVVKCGCVDESHECNLELSEEKIKEIINSRKFPKSIFIPSCDNQNELCNLVRKHIREDKNLIKKMKGNIRVFCEGHLPIKSITIAPMFDQNRVKEQVSRFCQSKYWLRDVDIRVSTIPYVPSINVY